MYNSIVINKLRSGRIPCFFNPYDSIDTFIFAHNYGIDPGVEHRTRFFGTEPRGTGPLPSRLPERNTRED